MLDPTQLESAKTIFEGFCTVALAVITLRLEFNRKKNKQLQELEAAAKAAEKQALDDHFKKIETSLQTMNGTLEGFKKQFTRLNNALKDHEKDIKRIEQMNKLNGQYTHELAVLVMSLSEGIRDNHLDGNITRAIEKYRKFEANTLGSIMSGENDMTGENVHHGHSNHDDEDESEE